MTFSLGSPHFGSVTLVYPTSVDLGDVKYTHPMTNQTHKATCHPRPYAYVDAHNNPGDLFVGDLERGRRNKYPIQLSGTDAEPLRNLINTLEATYANQEQRLKQDKRPKSQTLAVVNDDDVTLKDLLALLPNNFRRDAVKQKRTHFLRTTHLNLPTPLNLLFVSV